MCAAGAWLLSIISAALSRSKATRKCFVYCLKSKALPVRHELEPRARAKMRPRTRPPPAAAGAPSTRAGGQQPPPGRACGACAWRLPTQRVYSTYNGFNCAASVPSSSFDEGAKSSPEGRDSWPGWLHADEATDGTLWHRDPRPETLPDDKAGSVD